MARLTRQEKATGVGAGLLLGAIIGLVTQLAGLPLAAGIGLCVIGAAGLGAVLAAGRHGIW